MQYASYTLQVAVIYVFMVNKPQLTKYFFNLETKMKRTQAGFTLIELMIVIAILGILAAIAIPAYQDYSVRARISEGIAAAAPAKLAVSEFHQSEGGWPGSLGGAGASNVQTAMISSLTILGNGNIYIDIDEAGTGADNTDCATLGANGGNIVIRMEPGDAVAGATTWSCTGVDNNDGSNVALVAACARLLPSSCRN